MSGVVAGLALTCVGVVAARLGKLRLEQELLVAVGRAGLQLGFVAIIIRLIFGELGFAGLFVTVMTAVAAWTAHRRLAGVPGALRIAASAVVVSAGVSLGLLFATGAYRLEPRFLIPLAGILVGGAMVATSLAGARLRDELVHSSGEVEARLALGVDVREALSDYARRAATSALLPAIDQTKSVGLITLPGTFVGMILGGASPTQAAQVQLTVLFSLLGCQTIAALTTVYLVGRAFVGEGDRLIVPGSGRSLQA
jgi:putative ABC transport system permease protein